MRRVLLVLSLFVPVITLGPGAGAVPGDIILASTSDTGVVGNDFSSGSAISTDGTKVAFRSKASNLEAADTDSIIDVHVKDLVSGHVVLASASDTGVKGNDLSEGPALSMDGMKIAFYSSASNLDSADIDSVFDAYVKDLVTGNIILASTSDSGVKGNGDSLDMSLSHDGTKVAFESVANTLDSGDLDLEFDVYVKDLVTGDIFLASTSDSGTNGNGTNWDPALSADGKKVAFASSATNLDPTGVGGVYVKDLITGDITIASTSDSGVPGNCCSLEPDLSADGKKVAFFSSATNLDPADTDPNYDVYVKDLTTGNIILASTSDSGVKGIPDSTYPDLSADGTIVAFDSQAFNLDPGDTTDSFGQDVYVKNLTNGDITLVSVSDTGVKGNFHSRYPHLSGDGTKVVFDSDATNLHAADNNSKSDVFVKEPGGRLPVPPCPLSFFLDDLEPGATPGWTFDVAQNDAPSPTWALVDDSFAHSPDHSFNTDAVAPAIKDDRLIAPPQDLSSVSQLSFWHRFNFANGFDGGVLEVSNDGGTTWSDVLAGGGSFIEGGYSGTISEDFESPIGGRSAWTGVSGSINAMTRVQVSLGAFAGNDVRVRWRMGADNGLLPPGTGWWVDDVQFSGLLSNCAPAARDDFAATVNGIPITINVLANDGEPNGDPMTVTGITQPAHGTAVLNPNQTVRYDPMCSFQGTDTFTYTVSDGQGGTDTATVSVRARKTSRRGSFPC